MFKYIANLFILFTICSAYADGNNTILFWAGLVLTKLIMKIYWALGKGVVKLYPTADQNSGCYGANSHALQYPKCPDGNKRADNYQGDVKDVFYCTEFCFNCKDNGDNDTLARGNKYFGFYT